MNPRFRTIRGLALIGLLVVLGATPTFADIPGSQANPQAPPSSKIASNLGFLLSLEANGMGVSQDDSLGQELANIRTSGVVKVSARFTHELSPAERAQVQDLGVKFERVAGELAHVDRIYGLLVPTHAVDDLVAYPLTEWLEAAWRPAVLAPLDLSVPTSNVPAVWQEEVSYGAFSMPVTGDGVTIANFDTGIDVGHPLFLDGKDNMAPDECNWDDNLDGVFTPGLDKFPLPVTAYLRYVNAPGDPNDTGGFDVTQDWVYQDDNSNTVYDTNETIFLPWDTDGDRILEAGECLRPQGNLIGGIAESKIAYTLDATGVHTRGVDLASTATDTNGHGTSVSGILVGGNALRCAPGNMSCMVVYSDTRRYTGVAPDADLIVADRLNNSFPAYASWAAARGASIMLYEYGGWVYEYLDGSSNQELAMDALSDAGIVQVVPSGNLHGNGRHLQYQVPGGVLGGWLDSPFRVPGTLGANQIYASFVWLNPSKNLTVTLTTPSGGPGNSVNLACVSTADTGWKYTSTSDGHLVGCQRAPDSSRGTALYNLWITKTSGIVTGDWTMRVHNPGGPAEKVNFYITDDVTTWGGGVEWLNPSFLGVELHTATWPSTCDSCIAVASYATRANYGGTIGDISSFSGRGSRFFDGARIIDIAAPGHYDVITAQSQSVGGWGAYNPTFGGTSAAGPHVAGVAALLMQYSHNSAHPTDIETAIQRGARTDQFTEIPFDPTPNDTWGYGKLDAYNAFMSMKQDLGDAPDSSNHFGVVMSAYPGAFSGVQANFPTVYTGTTPLGSPGPIHWNAGDLATGPISACLGTAVSAESEADRGFDEDPLDPFWPGPAHNIDPINDTADGDRTGMVRSDDAFGLFVSPFPHCGNTTLPIDFTITGSSSITYYVNIWVDWNRDGDWGDELTCTTSGDTPEWVVQDLALVGYSAPGTYQVTTPAFTTYQPGDPYDPTWLRITLSEQKAPVDPGTGRADGRGPADGYMYGETEDHYIWFHPTPSFWVANTTVCMSQTVTFTNTSTGSRPITYTWNFGDGTVFTTTQKTLVTHHYMLPGNFRVELLATDMYGMPWGPDFVWITVNVAPYANFVSNSPVALGETAVFTNTSTGAIAYDWDFGDGVGTSTDQNPVYMYTQGGTYTVTLTALNNLGCTATHQEAFQVIGFKIFLPLVARNWP